ncbi:uncharacterized protein A4U43_C04F13960 [Asparagus officinalis]|uniref:HD-Zip IV C-terminal domain-containing protein n=2 Tax=Asparagus officinalis TaxID=4686 RepID=A0A5P1F5D8_ASPOF|nr:uncharacterized protein A4U43_C04F13960 [Asparagus officinalis]
MSGEDTSFIPLLPTGFILLPSPPPSSISSPDDVNIDVSAASGCLLTIGVQVLVSSVPSAKLNLSNVTAINNHISNAVQQISAALGNGGGGGNVEADASVETER